MITKKIYEDSSFKTSSILSSIRRCCLASSSVEGSGGWNSAFASLRFAAISVTRDG